MGSECKRFGFRGQTPERRAQKEKLPGAVLDDLLAGSPEVEG
jgi:hypothetical protein